MVSSINDIIDMTCARLFFFLHAPILMFIFNVGSKTISRLQREVCTFQ